MPYALGGVRRSYLYDENHILQVWYAFIVNELNLNMWN